MNTDMDINTEIPKNAISVYHQDNNMDDFPVLKAFQQYIDAEQSKARRRMVSLCIFFGVLMTIVIAIFMYMLRETTVRNQQLNDRLVEYAMRDRQPIVMPTPQPAVESPAAVSANEAAMRAMTDTLVALQKQIVEREQERRQMTAPEFKAPEPSIPPPQPEVVQMPAPSAEELDLARKNREAEEKLKRARALLDAEKKKLAEERERLRQEEIERHRRRLYPEYYAAKDKEAEQPKAVPPPPKKQITDDDIADILREVDAHASEFGGDDSFDDMEDAIEYFNEEDEAHAPSPSSAKSKGTSTTWNVPLD